MKYRYLVFFIFTMFYIIHVYAEDNDVFFYKYKVREIIKECDIILPKTYKTSNNRIYDENNKRVNVEINFAGKYSIVRHSCGTGCLYITLIDLTQGKEDMKLFSKFFITEENDVEIKGEKYIPYPITQKYSYGIIMKYVPENYPQYEVCYKEKYIYVAGELKLINKLEEVNCN